MAGVIFEIDPSGEEPPGTSLVIVDNSTYMLLEYNDDPNPWDVMLASSADTEGELLVQNRATNRTVTIKLRVVGTTAALLETAISGLQQKVGKLAREGGTLKKTTPTGDVVYFDVISATIASGADPFRYIKNQRAEVQLVFACKPYARGVPVQLADHVETTLPVLVFTETGLVGDVPCLGKLVIDNDDATNNQDHLIWGVQSRYYDSAASAGLFFEAEGRTLQGAAAIVTQTGSSGGGTNNAVRGTLTTEYTAILSTQATGGGAHLSHVGNYRVFARVLASGGGVLSLTTVALQWSEADFSVSTLNAPVSFDTGYTFPWRLVDLGQVHITKAVQGTQRWEGRILAKASEDTGSQLLTIDHLLLVPIDEGSGEAFSVAQLAAPSVAVGMDTFNQSAGALAGKTAAIGGAWAGSGEADDFTVNATTHKAERATVSDTNYRFEFLSNVYTSCAAQVTYTRPYNNLPLNGGLALRYVDINNVVVVHVTASTSAAALSVDVWVGGSVVNAAVKTIPVASNGSYLVRAWITPTGRVFAWAAPDGAPLGEALVLQDPAMATGGAVASGKAGIVDYTGSASASTRTFDYFFAWTSPTDAAIFASQSLELRPDSVIREDSAGAVWKRPAYEGDYLRLSPAGKENRTVRFIVKGCRNHLDLLNDPGIDDLSARLTYTPRYLQVPA